MRILNDMNETLELIRIWADDRNLILGATTQAQFVKLAEEMGELASALCRPVNETNLNKAFDAIGDMVVVLTIMASQLNTTIEHCAEMAYNEIKSRKGKMINGTYVKEEDLENVDK